MTAVADSHIVRDDRGVAWIDKTSTKVIEVAMDMLAHDWRPEDIHDQHPHLPLAGIYAALAYYYDYQTEMDTEIDRQLAQVIGLADVALDSPVRRKLRQMGKLP